MIKHFFTKQFLIFLAVGGLAASLNWLSRFFLSLWLPFSWAVINAYAIGMGVAFIMNSIFVFPHSKKARHAQARDFILVNLSFLPLVWLASIQINIGLKTVGMTAHSEELAHAIAIALPMLATFLIYKFFAFKEKDMDSNDLSELYKIRFTDDQLPRKNAIWKVICRSFLQAYIKPSDTVVDVACGYGEFLNNISAQNKIAVDLNADAAGFLGDDVEFHQCKATELGSAISKQADVVFTSNFLEHLPDKKTLDSFLEQVMSALKPGGKYLILGPNLRYLPGQYWDFYDHHLGLTHLSLSEALRLKGFTIHTCIDRFLPFTTQGALPTHPWLVWAYLKLPFAWKLFGKQFFIVAQKPL